MEIIIMVILMMIRNDYIIKEIISSKKVGKKLAQTFISV